MKIPAIRSHRQKVVQRMKKYSFLLIIITSAFLTSCNRDDSSINSEVKIPVSVEDIKIKSIEEFISTTGTVIPTHEVFLKSEMAGYYTLLTNPRTGKKYALGDKVNKGQVIIAINDEEYKNNIKIESQELRLEISKQVFDKQKSLYDKGGVTLSELKNAEIEYINSKYAYEDALLKLAKMKIKVPFAGVIVDLPYYTAGTKIEINTDIVKIMDYSKLYMEINLPEKHLNTVKIKQQVRVMNYTLPDSIFMGEITQLSPAIDPETRTFKGTLIIGNSDLLLRPGMFVRSEIVTAQKDSAIVIQKSIILSKRRGKTVFVIGKGEIVEECIITFGLENPEEVEVIAGLKKNQRLVVKGFETLQNRSKVKIIR